MTIYCYKYSNQYHNRLTAVERETYLKQLLGDDSAGEDSYASDSEDEDWIPLSERQSKGWKISDREEAVEAREGEVDDASEDIDESIESEEASNEPSESTTTFVAKDKTTWSRTPPIQHQTPARNMNRQKSGPHSGGLIDGLLRYFTIFLTLPVLLVI